MRGFMVLAVVATSLGPVGRSAGAIAGQTLTTSDTLGATARQAMIDIFRKRMRQQSAGISAHRSYSMTRPSRMASRNDVYCDGNSELTHR